MTYANPKDISYKIVETNQTGQIDQTRQQIHDLYNRHLAEKDRLIREMDKRDLRIVRLALLCNDDWRFYVVLGMLG